MRRSQASSSLVERVRKANAPCAYRSRSVVSSAASDPIQTLRGLYDPLTPPPPLNEQWFDANMLRTYIVLHDASNPAVPLERYGPMDLWGCWAAERHLR